MLQLKKYHIPSILGYSILIILFIIWMMIFPIEKEANSLGESIKIGLENLLYVVSAIQWFFIGILSICLLGIGWGWLSNKPQLMKTWILLLIITLTGIGLLILIANI